MNLDLSVVIDESPLSKFVQKLTRDRVVPIISASVSWLRVTGIGIGPSSLTASISSCGKDLYPAYNPKSLDQCVAVCKRCDLGARPLAALAARSVHQVRPDVAGVAEIYLPPQAQPARQFPELSFEQA
jgi:hypothetical protein